MNLKRKFSAFLCILVIAMSVWLPIAQAGDDKELKLPPPKSLRVGRLITEPELPKQLSWREMWAAESYVIEVYSEELDEVLFEIKTDESFYAFDVEEDEFDSVDDGFYFVRVAAVDEDGVRGRFSKCKWTYVGNLAELREENSTPKAELEEFCNDRLPAAVAPSRRPSGLPDNELSLELADQELERKWWRNAAYDDSQVHIEGASFLMSTDELINNDGDFATAMISTIRAFYWLNHRHGFEASFKSKLTDYNELGQQTNPTSLEGRYHFRWKMPFFWPKLIREFQASLFVGFEYFKNLASANQTFIKEYQLGKAGLALKFPLFDNWDTGGEFVYGYGPDGSAKLEIQGYIDYFFQHNWSFGLGYRLHLFSAGSADITPNGVLPFKEAYGEAFGNLRYSF